MWRRRRRRRNGRRGIPPLWGLLCASACSGLTQWQGGPPGLANEAQDDFGGRQVCLAACHTARYALQQARGQMVPEKLLARLLPLHRVGLHLLPRAVLLPRAREAAMPLEVQTALQCCSHAVRPQQGAAAPARAAPTHASSPSCLAANVMGSGSRCELS